MRIGLVKVRLACANERLMNCPAPVHLFFVFSPLIHLLFILAAPPLPVDLLFLFTLLPPFAFKFYALAALLFVFSPPFHLIFIFSVTLVFLKLITYLPPLISSLSSDRSSLLAPTGALYIMVCNYTFPPTF